MKSEVYWQQFIKSYWNYYLEIEERVLETKRFVDFDKANDNTFSFEYLSLIQAICSEIDVVAKIIAEYYEPEFQSEKIKNIQKWGYILQQVFPDIEQTTVLFQYDMTITPWKKWRYKKTVNAKGKAHYRLADKKETPKWWIAYNSIKHQRTSPYRKRTNYSRANLKNTIHALAALYLIEKMFLEYLMSTENEQPIDIKISESKLFRLASSLDLSIERND